ncbi:protein rai1 [Diplodia corticola]|uniref:Decapping nuclease n=1 Tax=Diplodia corticola TaxID=236234 RepID=A0A1J9RGF3_9PEZI|nr:protein rai1 [Diplodia corticola]OJD31619.1 protein rai1 [Diplodia corticola]
MSSPHADGSAESVPPAAYFQIDPRVNGDAFSGRPRNIHRPEEIAEFSYDENHDIHLDARSLSYYYPPQPRGVENHIYLDKGLESFRQLDDSQDGHLSGLLTAIMDMEQKQNAKTDAHFIAYRGMIANLLTMPYQKIDGWTMNATYFDGTIFIEEDKGAKFERKAREEDQSPAQKRRETLQYYYGFKFETLYTIPDIWDNVSRDEIESRDDKIVSNYAQYCSIVKTGVGDMNIVIGGEVDCIWDDKIPGAKYHNYVELKTTEWIDEAHLPRGEIKRKLLNYDRRKIKYWAQSFLIGCPTIIVAKKDTDGQVHMPLEVFKTNSIPTAIRNTSGLWNSVVCVQTLSAFLEWLQSYIKGSTGMWKLTKKPGMAPICLSHFTPTGTGQILTPSFKAHRIAMQAARVSRSPSAEGEHVGEEKDKMDTDEVEKRPSAEGEHVGEEKNKMDTDEVEKRPSAEGEHVGEDKEKMDTAEVEKHPSAEGKNGDEGGDTMDMEA